MNNTICNNGAFNNASATRAAVDDDSDKSSPETEEEADEAGPSSSKTKPDCNLNNAESSDSESETEILELDKLLAVRVSLIQGDWVTVKVYSQLFLKSKVASHSVEFMYIASIKEVEDDNLYTVLFLKHKTDSSYYWSDQEDIRTVDKADVVKMSMPEEEIMSRASRFRNLRVKYIFSKNDIKAARKVLKIPISNVC